MVYRELRETCSKLGEEMFSKSAEAGSKGTNYFSCHKDFTFLRACQNPLILKKSQSPDFHKPGLCYI